MDAQLLHGDNLLWVSETPNDRASKASGRPKIRSHVRKNVARQFRLNHKAVSQPQYPALAANQPRFPPLAIRSTFSGQAAQFCLNKDCSLRFTKPSAPVTSLKYQCQSSLVSDERSETEDLEKGGYREPRSDNIPRLVKSNEKEKVPVHQPYCKACGQRLSIGPPAVAQGYERQVVKREPFGRTSSGVKLIEILGAGRVDPFSCYPMEKPKRYVHELVDHTITYQLPGLFPENSSPSDFNTVVKSWASSFLKFPFLFHALVFSSSVHLDFQHTSKVFAYSPRVLTHKIVAIQQLNEVLADPKRSSADEVILTVFILAANEVFTSPDGRRNPFNPPLKNFRYMVLYGHAECIPEHMKALLDLVNLRGGIENLKLPGVAEILCCADVIAATKVLSPPALPLIKVSQNWLSALTTWAVASIRPRYQSAGFRKLKDFGITDEMFEVFEVIGDLTLAFTCHLQKSLTGFNVADLNRTRSPVQHILLCLPRAKELEQSDRTKLSVYECCRLTALIYSLGVCFPIPNTYDVLQGLVADLKISIESLGPSEACFPDMLLWILVLGGIASLDKEERVWYVSKLVILSKRLNLASWMKVEKILDTFLWFESACGPGGRLLWSEVMEVRKNFDPLK